MLDENTTFAGRYHIIRRLASGGMGAVYEARHLETGRSCALKVMLAHVAENANARERFRLEARAAAGVSSAHVVEVLDAGVDDTTGSPFLVMELLRGEDLGSRVARLGPLPRDEVALFVSQAARGLETLHRASIVHRDLKPSNLFLAEREPEAPVVKVLDLGVAKRVIDTAATTAVVGTPMFMAPEQMSNGKISPATDEYALAMVAYSLLVGHEYWAAEAEAATSTIAFALSTLDGPKEPPTERGAKLGVSIPAGFDAWFVRATARDPDARFPSVIEAATTLCVALEVDANALRIDVGRLVSNAHGQKDRAPDLNAFATTVTDSIVDKQSPATITLAADNASVVIPSKIESLSEAHIEEPSRKTKWRKTSIGAMAVLLIGAMVAGAFVLYDAKKPALPSNVDALNCTTAEITGPGASPRLAEVLGKGACARLGVEMGVPWLEARGARVQVRAELNDDRSAHVTLEVAGRKADGNGKTLIAATNAAIQNLAPMVPVVPMLPERIAVWGAQNEASARRIERAVRQKAFGFGEPLAIAQKIAKEEVDSPLSHAMLACALKRSDRAMAVVEKNEARKRLSLLPDKRAKIVESSLSGFIRTPDDPKNGAEILDSYVELGKDPDFTNLFTMCGCVWAEASLPMVDWLSKHEPVMGLPILRCMTDSGEVSPERSNAYFAWMNSVLPEWHGTYVDRLVRMGKVDEAREALIVREWLGDELTTRGDIAESKVLLAFASFEPREALAAAEELMGEPDAQMSRDGAWERINALLFAGKIRAAVAAADTEMVQLARVKKNTRLLGLASDQLRIRRLLGRPALSEELQRTLDETIATSTISESAQTQVELALLRGRTLNDATTNKAPAETLAKVTESELTRDYKNIYSLPEIRLRRGNEAAAMTYRDIQQASARMMGAFEAGLAFEAIGARAEAEKAYRLCTEEAWNFPFDAIAARVRLAEMARADGHEERARELMAIVDRAWIDADPDLRDIVRQMK